MWVRDDGLVVRQEVTVLRSRLMFVRLPRVVADELAEALGPGLSGELPDDLQTNLIEPLRQMTP
jgi:hypothetical protein